MQALLEVVVVVGLGRGEEGEVVSTVSHSSGHEGQGEPHPGGGQVGAQQQRPNGWGNQVGQDVLHRVSVDGHDANGGSPLMVALVDVLVETRVVEQPGMTLFFASECCSNHPGMHMCMNTLHHHHYIYILKDTITTDIIIMSIYHVLISALSAHIIHINLSMIFYTHVEDSPTKTIHTRHYMDTHTHTHTHARACAHTHND